MSTEQWSFSPVARVLEKDVLGRSHGDDDSYEAQKRWPLESLGRLSDLTIAMIEPRALMRDCFVRSLKVAAPGASILAFSSIREWIESPHLHSQASLVLLCLGSQKIKDEETERGISLLTGSPHSVPVVILSDMEDIDQMMSALAKGVRGFIPSSLNLDIAIEAMHLVKAGGIYVPANSLMSWKKTSEEQDTSDKGSADGKFTARQYAVLKALRQGKANKIIAYELNMRESTVKVHVRNIMRKLKARNRTEVAYLTSHETTA
ncbi:LuxR C-terminal-related transcriptional regulator [Microvirga pakistanensis]|uniref:LuxR C-terminal-related transcriptional regulator n=1 Tax=Microvirga pakistanensis TaxID=1682650 RepID=UPI00141A7E4D|nr:response regulator transcription factor [Microvirga pakistanensis]